MVERVGVEDEPRRAARKGPFDRAVEQPRADPAADIGEGQAEKHQFVGGQFEIADQGAVMPGDVQFMPGLRQERGEVGIGQQAPLVPQPGPADAVVEIAVEGGGGRRDAFQHHLDVGRRPAPRPVGRRHRQMRDRDRQPAIRARRRLVGEETKRR